MIKHTLGLVVCVVFTATNVLFAHTVPLSFWMKRNRALRPSIQSSYPAPKHPVPADVDIPSQWGRIQETYNGKSHFKLFILQDVHLNHEAQSNLAGLLTHLIEKKKVDFVALEGAFERFDFSSFRSFKNKQLTKKLADYFLKENLMGGPSYAGVTAKAELPPFIGVDDIGHYKANREAYKKSAQGQKRISERVEKFISQVQKKKEGVFNSDLLGFDRAVQGYEDGALSMGRFLSVLKPGAKDLQQFHAAWEIEQSLNFDQVEMERRRLLEKIIVHLTPQETQTLIEEGNGMILALAKKYRISFKNFQSFERYIDYIRLADSINANQLTQTLQKEIKDQYSLFIETNEEKALVNQSRHLHLTRKLINFSLTPREWNELDSRFRGNDDLLKTFADFYKEADIRTKKMFENILAVVPAKAGTQGAFVTGGFHTPHFTTLLRESNISYVVVSPNISKVELNDGTQYLSAFSQEKSKLEELFVGQKLFLLPSQTMLGSSYGANAYFLALRTALGEFVENGKTFVRIKSRAFTNQMGRVWGYIRVGSPIGVAGQSIQRLAPLPMVVFLPTSDIDFFSLGGFLSWFVALPVLALINFGPKGTPHPIPKLIDEAQRNYAVLETSDKRLQYLISRLYPGGRTYGLAEMGDKEVYTRYVASGGAIETWAVAWWARVKLFEEFRGFSTKKPLTYEDAIRIAAKIRSLSVSGVNYPAIVQEIWDSTWQQVDVRVSLKELELMARSQRFFFLSDREFRHNILDGEPAEIYVAPSMENFIQLTFKIPRFLSNGAGRIPRRGWEQFPPTYFSGADNLSASFTSANTKGQLSELDLAYLDMDHTLGLLARDKGKGQVDIAAVKKIESYLSKIAEPKGEIVLENPEEVKGVIQFAENELTEKSSVEEKINLLVRWIQPESKAYSLDQMTQKDRRRQFLEEGGDPKNWALAWWSRVKLFELLPKGDSLKRRYLLTTAIGAAADLDKDKQGDPYSFLVAAIGRAHWVRRRKQISVDYLREVVKQKRDFLVAYDSSALPFSPGDEVPFDNTHLIVPLYFEIPSFLVPKGRLPRRGWEQFPEGFADEFPDWAGKFIEYPDKYPLAELDASYLLPDLIQELIEKSNIPPGDKSQIKDLLDEIRRYQNGLNQPIAPEPPPPSISNGSGGSPSPSKKRLSPRRIRKGFILSGIIDELVQESLADEARKNGDQARVMPTGLKKLLGSLPFAASLGLDQFGTLKKEMANLDRGKLAVIPLDHTPEEVARRIVDQAASAVRDSHLVFLTDNADLQNYVRQVFGVHERVHVLNKTEGLYYRLSNEIVLDGTELETRLKRENLYDTYDLRVFTWEGVRLSLEGLSPRSALALAFFIEIDRNLNTLKRSFRRLRSLGTEYRLIKTAA